MILNKNKESKKKVEKFRVILRRIEIVMKLFEEADVPCDCFVVSLGGD